MSVPFDSDRFSARHLGPDVAEITVMLDEVGFMSMEELLGAVVPPAIRHHELLDLPAARTETRALADLERLAAGNQVLTSLIGMGYHDTLTPGVIARNILENPAWYTAYTPYQPEISQGRLEALLNFQTMVCDLTGTEVANASMLDEGTAAAEAMTMARRTVKDDRQVFFVDAGCHPQTIEVVRTRAEPIGIEVVVGAMPDATVAFGALLAHIGTTGEVRDLRAMIGELHAAGSFVAVVTDLLACCVVTPPGEQGADAVVGSAQRFGVPLGFGGPHAGFLATRERHARALPGRLVGVSVDTAGRRALRLALQTREQHIRREKATSNICTAQVLLAVISSMYACYHGPDGLRRIADEVHGRASALAAALRGGGIELAHDTWFDTVTAVVPGRAAAVVAAALEGGINLRLLDADRVGIAVDETTTDALLTLVLAAFGVTDPQQPHTGHAHHVGHIDEDGEGVCTAYGEPEPRLTAPSPLSGPLLRTSAYLTHPTFHRYRSETEMLRYLRRLSDLDLALDRTMIPLGSCTMKLNATSEMVPISWPSFAKVHPFAPADQTLGYTRLFADLESWLAEITGYDAVSLQPNAGSQGEYAGLLAIRSYHRSRGDTGRDICLIPSSAHGTNAASAVMAGMRVVVVACDDDGNIDMADLEAKAAAHADDLAAVMVTYPSTHGVFETGIVDLCDIVHSYGGQVYLDGANMNALVGVARPGSFGADVSHLNLHKTFCIPHGGGGPGVGPIAVRSHLAPFLPDHPLRPDAGPSTGTGPISAAPWGSASILPIPWMYIAMMGPDGLRSATATAILAANYVAARLAPHYPVLYTGAKGLVAHECILDIRPIEKSTGVSAEDIAKRLIDHGFHAPTMSFPVPGTLMVEPTESESLVELDRFCDAMISIRGEIERVGSGDWPLVDSPLRNAPHTAEDLLDETWERPYSPHLGAYPSGVPAAKYWPPVSRVDNGYGDRNLVCSCPPVEDFAHP